MNFNTWRPLYQQILLDMGYSQKKDEQSARVLARFLIEKRYLPLKDVRKHIEGKQVVVTGGGLTRDDISDIHSFRVIATGASIPLLLKNSITPFAIVTDLDGDLNAQKTQCERGAIAVIHAHGDNRHLLHEVKSFPGEIIGTCQCRPVPPLHNFGGFTDGDRAVAFAMRMHASRILLAGFRFDTPIPDTETKQKKLQWCKRIISILSTRYAPDVEIFYL